MSDDGFFDAVVGVHFADDLGDGVGMAFFTGIPVALPVPSISASARSAPRRSSS